MPRLARASSIRATAIWSDLLLAMASAISASSVGSPKVRHQSRSTSAFAFMASAGFACSSWFQDRATGTSELCIPGGVVAQATSTRAANATEREVLNLRMAFNLRVSGDSLFEGAHQHVEHRG